VLSTCAEKALRCAPRPIARIEEVTEAPSEIPAEGERPEGPDHCPWDEGRCLWGAWRLRGEMITLKRQVALVTGAGRGIGRAIGQALAGAGAAVAIADIDGPSAQAAAEALTTGATPALALTVDVADAAAVRAMVARTLEVLGGLHILVNNAGICPLSLIEEISGQEWDRVMDVNLKGPFLCTQAALPIMRQQRYGRIINIASVAGKMGALTAGAHYAASKGGLIAFTMCLARQYARHGITANAIAPGPTATDMTRDWLEEDKQKLRERIPLGRMAQPQDIAAAALFLASEEAGFITGEVLDVNGGFLMD
jgi:NAD(P)-dependent dehydrogenase (short-subunit alcohol dehydrogenase family)